MKRLLTVALGVALGSLATPATAARSHIWTSDNPDSFFERSDSSSRSRSTRRSAATRRHRHAGHSRSAARRSGRRNVARSNRRHASRSARSGMAARSFTRYATPGTSRGCLTPAARALLGRIESKFGRVQVVSTCRPGARIAGSGRVSRHASGNAVDFNVRGGSKAAVVRWLIANHRAGGTMTYARMGHIHVDIGPRFVALNSGAGYR